MSRMSHQLEIKIQRLDSSYEPEQVLYQDDHWLTVRRSCLQKYSVYYLFNLLSNVMLLSVYAVMVTAEHQDCLTKSGTNITHEFQIAFMVGLFVQLGDSINTNVLTILFRVKKQLEEREFGVTSAFTQRINKTTTFFEWSYRVMTILVCLFQYTIMTSKRGSYCVN